MMRHLDAAEPSRTGDFSNNQRRAQAAVLPYPGAAAGAVHRRSADLQLRRRLARSPDSA
jgi:hypothetical protein